MSANGRATLTPTSYILRCGEQHSEYGDDYTLSAHVQRIGKDKAFISGASGKWGPFRRIVLELLFNEGIRLLELERYDKNGTPCVKTIPIGDPNGNDK